MSEALAAYTIQEPNEVEFYEDQFGLFLDKTSGQSLPVRRFTWRNQSNIEVQVITYGATITTLKVPDSFGVLEDIVLGFDDVEGYQKKLNPYIGATIGRVANRIGAGRFQIDGQQYTVSTNNGNNTLHGGVRGFDKVNWDYSVQGKKVVLSYLSPDGEEGFPGAVLTNVSFELTNHNEFLVDFKATTTKPTFVNLTNHSYFNLAGHHRGAEELYKHVVSINGDKITVNNSEGIPTGEIKSVSDTIYDLRIPKTLGTVINNVPGGGYDNNFVITKGTKQRNAFHARVEHPPSGRILEIYSDQPGVQFYTSNFLPVKTADEQLTGKSGDAYNRHGAFCLETQNFPDALNHKSFPNGILRPGETYRHTVVYKLLWKNLTKKE